MSKKEAAARQNQKPFSSWKYWGAYSFLWGFLEGIFLFIVPDVIISYLTLKNKKAGLLSVFTSVLGSITSALVMFPLAKTVDMNAFLLKIPLVNPSQLNTAYQALKASGAGGVISGPMSGIPYKIYSVQASLLDIPFISYILCSILSRLTRLVPVFLIFMFLNLLLGPYIEKYPRLALGLFVFCWIGVYVFYALGVRG